MRGAQSTARAGQPAEALSRYQAALARSEAHLPALLGVVDLALRSEDFAIAAGAAEQLQRVHRDPALRRDAGLTSAAIAARLLGDPAHAVRVLRAVLEADPRSEVAFARLSALITESKD